MISYELFIVSPQIVTLPVFEVIEYSNINFAEEPFLLDDKVINNSFIKNQDEIIKNKNNINNNVNSMNTNTNNNEEFIKYNIILNNEHSQEMLDKDAPSSLNNSKRFIDSKNEQEDTNNYFDNYLQNLKMLSAQEIMNLSEVIINQ